MIPRASDIIDAVARYYRVTPAEIRGKSRASHIAYPRHVAYYLTREMTLLSWKQIGRTFGNRDHSTIIHGSRRIEMMVSANGPGADMDVHTIRTELERQYSPVLPVTEQQVTAAP